MNAWWKSKPISGLYKAIIVSVMLTSSFGYPRVANKKAKAGHVGHLVEQKEIQPLC